jgi:hypothetical protein
MPLRAIYMKFVKTPCCIWPEIAYIGTPLFQCVVSSEHANHIDGWSSKEQIINVMYPAENSGIGMIYRSVFRTN